MTGPEAARPQRRWPDYLGLAARGFAMGTVDVIPGVSGGTIAFVSGIYEELIEAIRALTLPANLKLLVTLQWRRALDVFPWPFLLALGIGLGAAVLTMAHVVSWALAHHPVFTWAFFFGLVLASTVSVMRHLRRWTPTMIANILFASVITYVFVGLLPVQTPTDWWFLIFSGALAICAMILPGISGSFVLVLLGKYTYVLNAVKTLDVVTLALVATGCLIGITVFAHVVSWLFRHYHDLTITGLTGLMIGSLRRVWPWQEVRGSVPGVDGEPVPVDVVNVLPAAFSGEVLGAILLAVLGFAVVLGFDWWSSRMAQARAAAAAA